MSVISLSSVVAHMQLSGCPAKAGPQVATHTTQLLPLSHWRPLAQPQTSKCFASQRGGQVKALASVTQTPTQDLANSQKASPENVGDVMTKKHVWTCNPDTSIDDALESLVEHRITGLPVVDEDGKVVGVVSDYDMLTLDNVSGPMEAAGMFPTASMDWEAFHEVQKMILKNTGKLVSDVMTADPLVVRPETNIEAAARILLQKKVRRLPVVDDTGRLIGMFTRGDVIKAALRARKAALEKRMAKK
ncbi:hypothetical protein ABBQ32_002754 [Trebouxia sp. C0010 RCD-2024]